jgi:hypothetical protein
MRLTGLLFFLVLLNAVAGCAQRSLTINSEPSGALVYLNGEEIGRTPVKYDFTWYSDYDVVLRKDGYETLKTHRGLKSPLSEVPPFDLFGELFGSKDVREWTFTMAPAQVEVADPEGLLSRAATLKGDLQSSQYTRPPTTFPTTKPSATTAPATRASAGGA